MLVVVAEPRQEPQEGTAGLWPGVGLKCPDQPAGAYGEVLDVAGGIARRRRLQPNGELGVVSRGGCPEQRQCQASPSREDRMQ